MFVRKPGLASTHQYELRGRAEQLRRREVVHLRMAGEEDLGPVRGERAVAAVDAQVALRPRRVDDAVLL